jgi:hypothetical protein
MSRAACVAMLLVLVGCSADPAPPLTSGTGEHEVAVGTAPTPPKSSETPAAPASASAAPARLPHEAKDPATLLGGGAALDALPVRATETGGRVDPGLRQRLMEPPL